MPGSTGKVPAEEDLRHAIANLADQIEAAVEGDFGFRVESPLADESLQRLVGLVNFVLGAAERAVQHAEGKNQLLRERNKDLEQFAYVASHDLQEPLRMVASFLQLLERRHADQLDDTAREYVHFAVDGAQRMQRLIRDLLQYSRIGTRAQPFEPVPVEEVLQQAIQDLRVAIDESGARIQHEPLPEVLGDSSQLIQLFANLLSNAIKFSGEGEPDIAIRVREDGGMWEFAVHDQGIGIAPEHAERIFQIFQRLHPREEYEGTGIGLAICKKIVEQHGGQIWLDSQSGGGTSFRFTLPRAA